MEEDKGSSPERAAKSDLTKSWHWQGNMNSKTAVGLFVFLYAFKFNEIYIFQFKAMYILVNFVPLPLQRHRLLLR